jgi:alpha-glucoside transport system permease protein
MGHEREGGPMVQAFGQVIILVGIFLAFLLGLYYLTRFLPGAWRERGQVLIFAGPAVFLVFAGLFVPAVRTIVASFRDDKGTKWIGFDNFHEIFSGKDTRLVVANTFTWVIGGTLFVVIVALAVARFADGMRGEKVWKSLIFIPAAIALAGAGIIWKFIYAGPPFKVGLANQVANAIPGLPASLGGNGDKIWLVDRNIGDVNPPGSAPGLNTFLLIVIFIWASTGLATVIFSAAIKGVPQELNEAARVDGATKRQVFYKVTLPFISVTVVTVATITAIAALKVFDIVAATTGGNFGTSTVANEFYRVYFVQNRLGFGSAYAVLLFLLVIPVVVMNRRAQQRAEERS